MLEDVKIALTRSGPYLWRDLLGAGGMLLTFFALLHLPALV
ncbi:MAG: hypothetical protein ACK5IB_11190 [Qingshengfaniella sp.]